MRRMFSSFLQRGRSRNTASTIVICALALSLAGCFGETFQRGYVLPRWRA